MTQWKRFIHISSFVCVLFAVFVIAGCDDGGGGGGGGGTPDNPDTTAPTVISVVPDTGSILANDGGIEITFSETMDQASLSIGGTMASEDNGGVWSTATVTDDKLTISPTSTWDDGTDKTLVIGGADLAGNPLAELDLTYTVDSQGPTADVSPPTGSTTDVNTMSITITFSKSMDTSSLEISGTMAAEDDGGAWSDTTLTDDTLTISPDSTWSDGAGKTLIINCEDTTGHPLPTLSLSYTVYIAPTDNAAGLEITDQDFDEDQLSGSVYITRAVDETHITGYVLYWGTDAATITGSAITTIAKTGNNLSYTMAANTAVPSGADYLLVFTRNGGLTSATPVAHDFKDRVYRLVKDIRPGSNDSNPTYLTLYNEQIFFSANDGTNGLELWHSDGTSDGTQMLTNIRSGSSSSNPKYLTRMNHYDDLLYFSANDGTNGNALWQSDGTSGGTAMVENMEDSDPTDLFVHDQKLYFGAEFSASGNEVLRLVQNESTPPTVMLITEIAADAADSSPMNFNVVNGDIFFSATDGTNGRELWWSDDCSFTIPGTGMVLNINELSTDSLPAIHNRCPNYWNIPFASSLYFSANDSAGQQLWKTNGTDIEKVSGYHSDPCNFVEGDDGYLYFYASRTDTSIGYELYRLDPSDDSITLVKDINSGAGNSIPSSFTTYPCVFNGKLYFAATDGTNGVELWESDGTEDGTVMVRDLVSGSGNGWPTWMIEYNDRLYFAADAGGTIGNELYEFFEK